ncbi:unnamed protein product, partial [Schistosoma turkestanicum]
CKIYLKEIDLRTTTLTTTATTTTTTTTALPSVISPETIIRTNLNAIAREISQLVVAMENDEYDFDGAKRP